MTGHGAYVAYPIDYGNEAPWMVILRRAVISRSLQEVSWVFDPGGAFSVAPKASPVSSVRSINNEALDRSSILVAILPKDVPSIGVPMEIERAVHVGKPVVLITNQSRSWALKFDKYENVEVVPLSTDPTEVINEFPSLREMIERHRPYEMDGVNRMEELPFMLGEQARLPTFSYDDDAGLDLIVSENTTIPPGQFIDIQHDVAVQLPEHTWGMITGRSSALRRLGLLINQGVIDAGYRGPLFAGVWNLTDSPVVVWKGERIAQLILIPNETRLYRPVQVDRLNETPRGTDGFGSTGA